MSVSQNIICSAAELSHTCFISYTRWMSSGQIPILVPRLALSHKNWLLKSVLGYEVPHPSEFLRAEVLEFTSCSSCPWKSPAWSPLWSTKPSFCWSFAFAWLLQKEFILCKVCLHLHPGFLPTSIGKILGFDYVSPGNFVFLVTTLDEVSRSESPEPDLPSLIYWLQHRASWQNPTDSNVNYRKNTKWKNSGNRGVSLPGRIFTEITKNLVKVNQFFLCHRLKNVHC